MIDELNQALETYQVKWRALVDDRHNKAFFEKLKPTAVGWKVTDRTEYDKLLAELRAHCDQIFDVWMNGRWIAKMHLRDKSLSGGIEVIKLMERRPGSTDAVGLDHVDFYGADVAHADEILAQESGITWTHETNDIMPDYSWTSVWFDNTEAKLRTYTVLDVCIAEMQRTRAHIISKE